MSQASDDSRQKVEQCWSKIRADIQTRWPQISDDELQMIDGDSRKLVALVQQRTHSPISEIEAAIDEIAAQSGGLLARVVQSASDFASMANRRISTQFSGAMQHTQGSVAAQPMPWLVGGFLAGLVVGGSLASLLDPPNRRQGWW